MDSDDRALRNACSALWLATISLMTAFMRTAAPAHRYMLARRIAANFGTLCEQGCFSTPSRTSFAKLAARWHYKAEQLAPEPRRLSDPSGLPAF